MVGRGQSRFRAGLGRRGLGQQRSQRFDERSDHAGRFIGTSARVAKEQPEQAHLLVPGIVSVADLGLGDPMFRLEFPPAEQAALIDGLSQIKPLGVRELGDDFGKVVREILFERGGELLFPSQPRWSQAEPLEHRPQHLSAHFHQVFVQRNHALMQPENTTGGKPGKAYGNANDRSSNAGRNSKAKAQGHTSQSVARSREFPIGTV